MEKENELRTWIVIDSDGDRHEVTAHYIMQGVSNGYTSFVTDGERELGILDTFYHPRSVTLQKQKLSGPPENYPVEISAPPAEVNGFRVLAWAEKKRREGEYPNGIALVHRPDHYGHPYVTWEAYTKDGGKTWEAGTGGYLPTFEDGWKSFTERCRNLAEK